MLTLGPVITSTHLVSRSKNAIIIIKLSEI
jgi:hypothetical protein